MKWEVSNAMHGSCHGNHERKEGVEWKVKWRVPDRHGVAAHWPNIPYSLV
jgi:hypothetical protein